jgi:cell wall-associated NlpC family hydrolase
MEAWRQRILTAAETWLLTPWAHNQCVKRAGVDCGRFLHASYAEADLAAPVDFGTYPADWMLHRSEERFLGWVERYLDPVGYPQPGDVAVWKFGRCFSHGAIVVDWPRIIHAYVPCRMVTRDDASKGALVDRPVLFYSIAARLEAS